MSNGKSLIDLGDLSKPATVLVKKVCNAVGVLYEPTRIRKRAKAEADAAKTAALANIEISALEQRAVQRLIHQEARKQENIEAITAQAADALPDDADVENLDEDWVAHFFKNCDTVSDKEMQTLWSSLLSGEATKPGSYSKRTVDLVASMDKWEAELFTKLGQFCWHLGDFVPLIYDEKERVYTDRGVGFTELKHLDAIGLISFSPSSGYQRMNLAKQTWVLYYGMPIALEFVNDNKNVLTVGKALLTQMGQQLLPICGAQRNDEFRDYIIEHWTNENLHPSSPIPAAQQIFKELQQ